ncbi:type III polyketide synthase [Alteribacillus iranensis]|uniref:15-methylpalmitoyl-4-hydroxy-2-pyrone synthase n=1 Tax=Alteribacillus iranensis TaxID=930128 RepID=A0A1I2E8Z4_9BACI|nr:3-oxoacyl-[acyl-carrier-protein] synthase III C-terminal domain-containing protein [Alteribacillus iranensis]SFE89099.1 15-methylpalmitoyl-4-hydroxy-2-pyrone synthase [Alteribacillus iranensis]
MPVIEHVVTQNAPYRVSQEETVEVVRGLFGDHFRDIERLLQVFENGKINNRYLAAPLSWFQEEHGLEEKNQLYIEQSVKMGSQAIANCLSQTNTDPNEIEAIIFISSSGMATPTIDARIINELSLPLHIKRIPVWGLGCAGGAAGVSRAHDYLLAYPQAKVLVLCIELCSLTFQREDFSKSNLVGTSLFADGAACVLMSGDQLAHTGLKPKTVDTQSTLMPNSEDVMGWDVKDSGLHVIFSRSIPAIIENWLKPNVEQFLHRLGKKETDIDHFVAHPGGKKVLHAYEKSLGFPNEKTKPSQTILSSYGNMSSPTVLYVLKYIMEQGPSDGDQGLLTALGPGFSSEMVWLEWRE